MSPPLPALHTLRCAVGECVFVGNTANPCNSRWLVAAHEAVPKGADPGQAVDLTGYFLNPTRHIVDIKILKWINQR